MKPGKTILLLSVFLLFPFIAYSQNNIVTIQILEGLKGTPLSNAMVIANEDTVFSNPKGFVQLNLNPEEIFEIFHVGYEHYEYITPKAKFFRISLPILANKLGILFANVDSTDAEEKAPSENRIYSNYHGNKIVFQSAYPEKGLDYFKYELKHELSSVPSNHYSSLFERNFEILFQINESGKLKPIKTKSDSISTEEFEALIIAFKNINNWKPALQAGKPTVQYFLITLALNKALVEELAQPVGGYPEFYKYVSKMLDYPSKALIKGIQGKVFVEFVVNEDGSVSDVKVIRGIGYGCDEEAIWIVKSSPIWIPAKLSGIPVKQKIVLPITFKLN